MSYCIFKYFNIKNGKANAIVAESNVFREKRDSLGRMRQAMIFRRSTYDFHVADMTIVLHSSEQIDNPYYALTDEEIYAKWMLGSAYGGGKYYEERHKAAINLIESWVKKRNRENVQGFLVSKNMSSDAYTTLNLAERRNLGFDEHRIYYDPTDEEFKELTEHLVEFSDFFKLRKRAIIISPCEDSPKQRYVTNVSTRKVTFDFSPPAKQTYFSDVQVKRVQKVFGEDRVQIL